ncbi:MAG: hypothetical protein J5613_04265 [Alphaproteobacteria bacterium]|nr:hypothetical protein [Alphaproteobacteria bacterium]
MRMFFLFILLFVQLTTTAEAANCDSYNDPFNSAACITEPGCMVQNSVCAPCQLGHYCPANASSVCGSTNGACECPAPFSATETTGATDSTECRIKITECITGGFNLGSYPTEPINPIYVKCNPNNWQTGSGSPYCYNADSYLVQRNPNEGCLDKVARDWFSNNVLDVEEAVAFSSNDFAVFFDTYHFEVKQKYGTAPTGGQWIAKNNDFELVCVKNTLSCGVFKNFPTDTDDAVGAAVDSIHLQNGCGDIPGTNCPLDATRGGEATWVSTGSNSIGVWDVHECTCTMDNGPIGDPLYCYGGVITHADTRTSSATNTVHSIFENVIYYTTDEDPEISGNCSHCFEDNRQHMNESYFVHNDDFVSGKVVACTPARIHNSNTYRFKGYYRDLTVDGFCGAATHASNQSFITNPCARVKCPSGETTADLLPIGINNCTFGSDTAICDAAGCKSLSNVLSGVAPDSWNPLLYIQKQ